MMTPRFSLLGTTAALWDAADGVAALPTQQRIWALAEAVAPWDDIREAVPGMNNLMLVFTRPPADLDAFRNRLADAWAGATPLPLDGRIVELPVHYGGERGPHMDDVLAHTGLSLDELVERHAAPLYPVFALGSHPGYCYLGGMDARIATPRRQVPVLRIPGGAVSIGGAQTGVSASDGPSGWNTIGHTDFTFFDAARSPPALLQPGDSIRFRPVGVAR